MNENMDTNSNLMCNGPASSPSASIRETSSAASSSTANSSEEAAVSDSTANSAPSSLYTDGGGEHSAVATGAATPHSPQSGAGNDIFVMHCEGLLIPDVEEPNIFVVDCMPAGDVLENALRTGTFAGTV